MSYEQKECNHAWQFVPWDKHVFGDALYKCILCGKIKVG